MLPTRFRVGQAAATAVGAAAQAAASVWERCGGEPQTISIDLRRAAASLQSFLHLKLNGDPFPIAPGELPTMAIFRGQDGRWIHLHGALPHLRADTLALLGAEDRADAITAAVARWPVFELEDALAAAGQCSAVLRTAREWSAHPQGQALATEPLIELLRIGDAPRRPARAAKRPLQGVRVLGMTRILAGPTCGRTLAEHGADVLRISAAHLPDVDSFVPDTSHGKRSAWLDLRDRQGREALWRLIAQTDIYSQGYRSGALDALGYTPDALATARPGIICVSINAYGH